MKLSMSGRFKSLLWLWSGVRKIHPVTGTMLRFCFIFHHNMASKIADTGRDNRKSDPEASGFSFIISLKNMREICCINSWSVVLDADNDIFRLICESIRDFNL